MKNELDYLAKKIILALGKTGMDENWIKQKEASFLGETRFEILSRLNEFDSKNLTAICKEFQIDSKDMIATMRVLRIVNQIL